MSSVPSHTGLYSKWIVCCEERKPRVSHNCWAQNQWGNLTHGPGYGSGHPCLLFQKGCGRKLCQGWNWSSVLPCLRPTQVKFFNGSDCNPVWICLIQPQSNLISFNHFLPHREGPFPGKMKSGRHFSWSLYSTLTCSCPRTWWLVSCFK